MSETTELGEATRLLLDRMQTHPEEFDGINLKDAYDSGFTSYLGSGRNWRAVIARYWSVLEEVEQNAITEALRTANRYCMTRMVISTVLHEHKHEEPTRVESNRIAVSPGQGMLVGNGMQQVPKRNVINTTSTDAWLADGRK